MRFSKKNVLGILTVLGVVLCAAFCYLLLRAPVFEKGESYTFYLGRSSSALMKETDRPALQKIFLDVKGESAVFEGDRLEELEEKFHARLLFTEEAAGIKNYYFFSPDLGAGVKIGNDTVNLHIALGRGRTAAGTPLIFGGF